MPTRRMLLVLATIALFGGLGWWLTRSPPSDADRVREVVRAIAAAAESADTNGVMDHISKAYRAADEGEALDHATLKSFLAGQFLRRGPIAVVIGDIAVQVKGDTAHASFDALVLEGSGKWSDLLPRNGDGWHLEVDFAREAEDWRVVRSERASYSRRQ